MTNEEKQKLKEEKAAARAARKAEQKSKLGGFWTEFKTFISKGNIVQLAVAFIMGAAFTAIVNSFVGDLIMPVISLIMGKVDIENLHWVVSPELTFNYGKFILAIMNFLIVALFLFLMIKAFAKAESGVKKLKKRGKQTEIEVAVTPPPPPPEKLEDIMKDIRELLRNQTENDKDKTKK